MSTKPFNRDIESDFDIEDPEFNERFYEVLDEFVAKFPVAQSKVGDGYKLINSFNGVKKAGQNWQQFSSAKGFEPNRDPERPYLMPEESDPPNHTAWRRTLNPFFAPAAIGEFEDSIRAEAVRLIELFADRGECDYVPEFSSVLPGSAMFKNLLGLPEEDVPTLIHHMDAGFYGPKEARAGHMVTVFTHLGEYLGKRAKEEPRGDVVDAIAAGVTYEDGEESSWDDRVSILTDLALGGIVTATFVMSGAMYHLATHPEDRRALAEDPSLIPQAIEEFVRFYPPVVALGRSVTEDLTLEGHDFKKGDFVLLNYASASRDPAAVDNPTTLDIRRKRVSHSAFGVGVHRCIGSHLARLEIRVALEEFLKRIPDFDLKEGTEPVFETGILRSMKALNLVWSGSANGQETAS